jgi:general secretion pathway protein G
MKRKKTKRKAFTLVELLVVVLIITMLAAFVAPRLFTGVGKTKADLTRAKMAILESALARFYIDCGRYPDDSEGLGALVTAPPDMEEGKWNGPYCKTSDLLDLWDNPYIYVAEGEFNPGNFDLISYGQDGMDGGEGDNADIVNQ